MMHQIARNRHRPRPIGPLMRDYESNVSSDDRPAGAATVAPGKRTLTQGLAPHFDPEGEYMESRATIDGPPELTPQQRRRARRHNRRWQRKLGFDPAQWSAAPIESEEFAMDVAAKQAKAGLRVDGIVGPQTAAAASKADDPFALHLIDL
jgi:hypothetical protein